MLMLRAAFYIQASGHQKLLKSSELFNNKDMFRPQFENIMEMCIFSCINNI